MNKTLEILEKHVQWLALGLGVAYFVWIVIGSLQPPTLEFQGKQLAPGSADKELLNSAKSVEIAMKSEDVPQVQIPDYSERFQSTLVGADQAVALGGAKLVNSLPPQMRIEQNEVQQILPDNARPIAALPGPIAPPKITRPVAKGRSLVNLGREGEEPKQEDIDWVTVHFSIPTAEIAKAFAAVDLPDVAFPTSVARVELVRREMGENGQWGPEQVVPPLKIHIMPPFPGRDGNRFAQEQYLNWAMANSQLVVTPPFYDVVAGDQWTPQGAKRPAVAAAKPKPQAPANQPRQPQPGQGAIPGGGGAPPGLQEYIQEMMRRGQGNRAPRDPMPPLGPGIPDYIRRSIEENMRKNQAEFQRQQAAEEKKKRDPLALDGPLPEGSFDPRKTPAIEGWVHDDTVQPGKTYQYKVRYLIKNPIFKVPALAKDPKMAAQVLLESLESPWTNSLYIQPRTVFFVVGGIPPDAENVRVQVFSFKDGRWHENTQSVSAGDSVLPAPGSSDTTWTVVDLQKNPLTLDTEAVFVDADGRIIYRAYNLDHKDPLLKDLREQAAAGTANNAVGLAQ